MTSKWEEEKKREKKRERERNGSSVKIVCFIFNTKPIAGSLHCFPISVLIHIHIYVMFECRTNIKKNEWWMRSAVGKAFTVRYASSASSQRNLIHSFWVFDKLPSSPHTCRRWLKQQSPSIQTSGCIEMHFEFIQRITIGLCSWNVCIKNWLRSFAPWPISFNKTNLFRSFATTNWTIEFERICVTDQSSTTFDECHADI